MKKNRRFFFLLAPLAFLFFVSSATSLRATDLGAPNVRFSAVVPTKNPSDPDKSSAITTASLPFSLRIYLSDESPTLLTAEAVMSLNPSGFYPADANRLVYSRFDPGSSSFLLSGLLFDGSTNNLAVTIRFFGEETDYYIPIYEAILLPSTGPGTPSQPGGLSGFSSALAVSSTASSKATLPVSLTPHLLLASYTHDKNPVANAPFSVTITLQNVSATLPIENAVITLTTSPKDFHLINTNQTIYFAKIAPHAKVDFAVSCLATADIAVGSVLIDIAFEYMDIGKTAPSKGADLSTLSVRLAKNTSLRLEKIVLPEETFAGITFPLGYRIANVGRGDVQGVDLSVLGADGTELCRTFLGDLRGGATVSAPPLDLYFAETGVFPLELVVYYQDERGSTHQVSAPFSLALTPPPDAEESQSSGGTNIFVEGATPAGGISFPTLIFLLTMLSGAAYGVFFLLQKKTDPAAKKERETPLRLHDFRTKALISNLDPPQNDDPSGD